MLHKHAAAIRPYPLPTRQHAAARPNSRQIRQMSAMPANPPFQSQFAARPNNRRHHQPTATHPQTTSTPNLSQTLMISRQTLDLSSNAHTSAPAPAAPLPSRKSPQITKNHSFRQSPNRRKLSSTQNTHSTIPKIPQNPANPASDNPPNLSYLVQTLTRRICPENPPKSCKSSSRQPAQLKSQLPNIP